MVSEYVQMLSTTHRLFYGKPGTLIHKKKGLVEYPYVLDGEEGKDPILPLATHINHPQNKWVRASKLNYKTLHMLSHALENEYYHRYGSRKRKPVRHAYKPLIDGILTHTPVDIPDGPLSPPPQTMGEEYRRGNVIDGYRNFIANGKAEKLHVWSQRQEPEWLKEWKQKRGA
jgi:hypothetical protein